MVLRAVLALALLTVAVICASITGMYFSEARFARAKNPKQAAIFAGISTATATTAIVFAYVGIKLVAQ